MFFVANLFLFSGGGRNHNFSNFFLFWAGHLKTPLFRKVLDTFNFLRHVMRAIWSVRPKCSHRCVSLKETPLKPVQILSHTSKNSTEQTAMRTKWFTHIAILTVQAHFLSLAGGGSQGSVCCCCAVSSLLPDLRNHQHPRRQPTRVHHV